MNCPVHKIPMKRSGTQYGDRWHCPCKSCSIVSWGRSTSTPADDETRRLRKVAHLAFDSLWRNTHSTMKIMNRNEAYDRLSLFLGLDRNDCHIGMFNIDKCKKTIEFSKQMRDAK